MTQPCPPGLTGWLSWQVIVVAACRMASSRSAAVRPAWAAEAGRVGGVQAVEAEQDVEVDRATDLVFGGFAVGDPDRGDSRTGLPPTRLKGSRGGGRAGRGAVRWPVWCGATVPGGVVPDDVGLVVIAVRTQRLPEHRVAGAVPREAGYGPAVRAGLRGRGGRDTAAVGTRSGLIGAAVSPDGPGVNEAEGRSGESGEHGWVSGDVLGDAFATDQPRADELEGVAPIGPRRTGTPRCGGSRRLCR